MKVRIAEKPSVAREIASVLGANTKHDYVTNLIIKFFAYICQCKTS
jgi:DNA topoisomerase IA